MSPVLDQYKQIQEKIADRKQPTENALAKAKYYGYTDEQVNQEIQGQQIPNQTTSMPINAPTTMPLNGNNNPVPAQPAPQPPPPAPNQIAGTTIQAPQTTPTATVEKDILSPNVTGKVDPNQAKLEQANLNKLNSNLSLYSTGKSLYDAVQGGSLLPGTKEFTDLTTRNPQVLQEYNLIKADKAKTDTVKALGNAIVGEPVQTPPSNALEQLVSFFTKSMDTDVAGEYQNSVINNPAYQASIQQMNGINQQIADNNKNINALRDDVRKKYSAGTPESLIASAIAREARPLIEQGQYLSELQKNAQSEMTRLFEENKQVFDLKQEERNTKNQRMIDLYGTIRNEEIRQEDFARADALLADQIARTDKKDAETLARLEQERMDNVKLAIVGLGVKPTGETYDELLGEYATAVKNKPIDNKPFTVGKDSYVFDPATGKYILPPGATNTPTRNAPAPNRTPTIKSGFTPEGTFKVDIANGATPRKSDRGYYECAMLVNDVIGTAMPDLHTDKLKYVNSDQPIVGGAFIEKTNDKYGHTGIVESVNADGTINIVETNYPLGSGVTRKTIDPSKRNIVGYYDPQTAGQAGESIKDFASDEIALFNSNKYNPQTDKNASRVERYEKYQNALALLQSDENAPTEDLMSATRGLKSLDATANKAYKDMSLVVGQLEGLKSSIDKYNKDKVFGDYLSPISGLISNANPWNTKAADVKARLQAVVPKVARGIFGEVGVLTDQDIANYIQTLPNIKQTADVQDVVQLALLGTLKNALDSAVRQDASTYNVSGMVGNYKKISNKIAELKSRVSEGQTTQTTDYKGITLPGATTPASTGGYKGYSLPN